MMKAKLELLNVRELTTTDGGTTVYIPGLGPDQPLNFPFPFPYGG